MNKTEMYIMKLLKSIRVHDSCLMTVDDIAERLSFNVHYWPHTSAIAEFNGENNVFINDKLNKRQQWQDFGHEMCHYVWHHGPQQYLRESYAEYQEDKANYFMYHFCIPTFMLERYKVNSVREIMNMFNVEFDFAVRRLEMYESKLISRGMVYVM